MGGFASIFVDEFTSFDAYTVACGNLSLVSASKYPEGFAMTRIIRRLPQMTLAVFLTGTTLTTPAAFAGDQRSAEPRDRVRSTSSQTSSQYRAPARSYKPATSSYRAPSSSYKPAQPGYKPVKPGYKPAPSTYRSPTTADRPTNQATRPAPGRFYQPPQEAMRKPGQTLIRDHQPVNTVPNRRPRPTASTSGYEPPVLPYEPAINPYQPEPVVPPAREVIRTAPERPVAESRPVGDHRGQGHRRGHRGHGHYSSGHYDWQLTYNRRYHPQRYDHWYHNAGHRFPIEQSYSVWLNSYNQLYRPGYFTSYLPSYYNRVRYNNDWYYTYGGLYFYREYGRYNLVSAPIGLRISVLPHHTIGFRHGSDIYFNAYNNYYRYLPDSREYIVTELPDYDGEYGYSESRPLNETTQVSYHDGDPFYYPADGQSEAQMSLDLDECHVWSVRETNFDPTLPYPSYDEYKADGYRLAFDACMTSRGYRVI